MTTHATTATQADAAPATDVMGMLALELAPGSRFGRAALPQQGAGRLANLLGHDLGLVVEGVRELDLVFAAAHFDPAEVLRPGWPLHRRLAELRQRAPQSGGGPRIIAFGADAAGQVPLPLQADEALQGGQLRVLPFLFAGDAAAATAVAARMEQILLDLGMARAETALCAQEAFAGRIEHARYLTVHDLAAMTALQYRNQGLEALWPVLETALLSPHDTAELATPPEPGVRYAAGEARIAMLSADAWCRSHARAAQVDPQAEPERAARAYAMFEARQRQFAAVLQAHGIEVVFDYADEPHAAHPRQP